MHSMIKKNRIKTICFCLSLHLGSHEYSDAILRERISNALSEFPSFYWKPGTYWETSQLEKRSQFEKSFFREVSDFEKYYEGIQTRGIGSIIIDEPNIFLDNSKSSKYIVTFRKIHDGYNILFFSFSKTINTDLLNCPIHFNNLKNEVLELSEYLLFNAPEKFNMYWLGPPTFFYLINQVDEDIELEIELNNPLSELISFMKNLFRTRGVKYQNLPRSSIDDKILVIRHPSYHYTHDLSEMFIFLPFGKEIDSHLMIRTVDIFSSIEYYFTKFFAFIGTARTTLNEIHDLTQPIYPLLKKASFPTLSPKETNPLLTEITDRSQNLFTKYPTADRILEEAEHAFNDASYLISGIVSPSSYSQITENRLSSTIEGAAESIGKEFQMRLHHIKTTLPRMIGRSSYTITSVSNLIHAHYEHILNKTMVVYTKQIKILTVAILILTIISMIFATISLSPQIKDLILNIFKG